MSCRRTLLIVLMCLTGAVGLAMVLLPNVRAGRGLSLLFVAAGAPLLIAAAVGLGYGLGRRTLRGVTDLAGQLDDMAASGTYGDLEGHEGGEIGQLRGSLNALVRRVTEDVRTRTMELRESQIRTRVLLADKQHMEAVLNSIADAVLVTNPFGEVTLANGSAEQVLDFRFDRATRRPLAELCEAAPLLAAVDQLRRSEHHLSRKVVEFSLGSNGSTRSYKATVNAVRTAVAEGEELSGLVAVFHDVTREQEIARAKSEFVSKVTHELRTPLSSIRAYVEMLVDGEAEDADTREEFYKIIDSESDRLSRMIDNILNISRIEAGVIKVQKDDVAIGAVIKEVVECLRPQAADKQIALEADLPPIFYQVHGDRDMLHQAVMNVVSNALKYTPDGGCVTVASQQQGGMAVVRVTDTGMGIPPEDLPRLFQKFYRVGANKKAAKGTGLGLALVREIVETLHHGEVGVESEVGKGTTFELKFPIAE